MELIFSYIFTILVVVAIGGIGLFAKRYIGTWINPSSIFSFLWVIYITIPIAVGFGVDFNPFGTMFILLFIFAFSLSVCIFRWDVAFRENRKKIPLLVIFQEKYFVGIFFVFVILAIFCHLFDLFYQGIDLSLDLITIGSEYAARRYSGDLDQNIFSKVALLASFQCCFLGGLIFEASASTKKRIAILAISFIPSLFIMIIQSAKGLFFLSAALFIGSWIVIRIFLNKYNLPKINARYLIISGLLVVVFVGFSFMSRGIGSFDDISQVFQMLKYYFASYSSGHFFAFSDWFSSRYLSKSIFLEYDQPEFTAGFYSFMGIFRALGDNRFVPLGVYDEYFELDGLLMTNIYTIFRGLITDFGIFGSLLFALFSGFLANFMFYILLVKKFSPFGITFFVFFVGIAYQSYIISSLTWISIPASFFVSVGILSIFKFTHPSLFLLQKSRYSSRESLEQKKTEESSNV